MTDLAARQAELVRALLAEGPVPAGFDPDRVRAEATALLAKRRRVTARLRPDLAAALGERFRPLFDCWARDNPHRSEVSFRSDVDAFARWLHHSGHHPA
jgi:hypothetical protein